MWTVFCEVLITNQVLRNYRAMKTDDPVISRLPLNLGYTFQSVWTWQIGKYFVNYMQFKISIMLSFNYSWLWDCQTYLWKEKAYLDARAWFTWEKLSRAEEEKGGKLHTAEQTLEGIWKGHHTSLRTSTSYRKPYSLVSVLMIMKSVCVES